MCLRLRPGAATGLGFASLTQGMGSTPSRRIRELIFGAATLGSTCAQAQWAVTVGAESDYRFRGVSLSDSRPSVRLSLALDASDGGYAGLSATRAAAGSGSHYTHAVAYAGRVMSVTDTARVEIGGTYAHFAGDSAYDYGEAFAGLLGDRWAARLSFAPHYFGQHRRTLYGEFNAWLPMTDATRLFGHFGASATVGGLRGRTEQAWGDLRVGAGYSLGDWDFQLAWVAGGHLPRPPDPSRAGRAAWVIGASASF